MAVQGYDKEGDEAGARHVAQLGIERVLRHLEDYPDNPRAYYLGTSGLATLGETDRAIEWAERALTLSPDDASTRYRNEIAESHVLRAADVLPRFTGCGGHALRRSRAGERQHPDR